MLLFRRPSTPEICAFLESQAKLDLTYMAVGATAVESPSGYDVDHTRIKLGTGQATFTSVKSALRNWEHFRLGWVEPCWPDTLIEPGKVVGVLAHVFGLWFLNACRIVYVIDEEGPVTKFGFAYGTLPDHAESGEERFTVEWHQDDDSVWYDILAISRPNQLLARLGYPLVRRLQRRFATDSVAAMQRVVNSSRHEGGSL